MFNNKILKLISSVSLVAATALHAVVLTGTIDENTPMFESNDQAEYWCQGVGNDPVEVRPFEVSVDGTYSFSDLIQTGGTDTHEEGSGGIFYQINTIDGASFTPIINYSNYPGINPIEAAPTGTLTAGTQYYFIVATACFDGSVIPIQYSITLSGDGEIVISYPTTEGYFDKTVAGNGKLPSQRNAQRLDDFIGTGMDDFKTVLDACSTDECVAAAIDELEIKLAGAGVGAAKQTAQAVAKIIRERQTTNFGGGNSGEEMFTENNFWFKPFGTWGEQDDKDNISGYDVNTYGFGIGIDGTNKDEQQFGAALFYNKSNVDVNNANQNADIDGFTVMGYGSLPVIDAKTKFLYQLSYSWQNTDTSRETVLGTAIADYTSRVASIDLSLMRDYQVSNEWLLQPTVGVTYTHFTTPSYSESGAGVAGSDVDKFTTSEFLFNLGTKANYRIDDSSKLITTLDISYDMLDKNDVITATTQGGLQLVDTGSIDNGRFGYAVEVGYEKELTNNSSINFSYEYAGEGSSYSTNTISAKYVYTF